MRLITQQELEGLDNYPYIEQAMSIPYSGRKACKPFTPSGYVSVAAIYNLSNWVGHNTSSLDRHKRAIAEAIQDLPLYELMKLNKGRRSNQPALFPDGKELSAPKRNTK